MKINSKNIKLLNFDFKKIKNKLVKEQASFSMDLIIMLFLSIILFSIFSLIINSFVTNIKVVKSQAQTMKIAQKYLDEFIQKANIDQELNDKIMEIDDGYLVTNYYDDNIYPNKISIHITDIANLSSKYANYKKGLVKKIDFDVYYEYMNNDYKITLNTVISKKMGKTYE